MNPMGKLPIGFLWVASPQKEVAIKSVLWPKLEAYFWDRLKNGISRLALSSFKSKKAWMVS